MYRITYYQEFEKFYCFVIASSEKEAVEIFHREVTDREPESVSECRCGIAILHARR